MRALRCSQGPKQIPASWCRFISELLSTTGMLWGAGNQEPMDPAEEAELKQFIGDHTGDYDSTVPHSFLICYVDDFAFLTRFSQEVFTVSSVSRWSNSVPTIEAGRETRELPRAWLNKLNLRGDCKDRLGEGPTPHDHMEFINVSLYHCATHRGC